MLDQKYRVEVRVGVWWILIERWVVTSLFVPESFNYELILTVDHTCTHLWSRRSWCSWSRGCHWEREHHKLCRWQICTRRAWPPAGDLEKRILDAANWPVMRNLSCLNLDLWNSHSANTQESATQEPDLQIHAASDILMSSWRRSSWLGYHWLILSIYHRKSQTSLPETATVEPRD